MNMGLIKNVSKSWESKGKVAMMPYHNIHNFVIKYYQGFSSYGQFPPWLMMKTSFSQQAFQRDSWVS